MFWLLFSVFQISLCSLVKVHKNAKALSILNIKKKTVKMHVFHLLAASMARVGGTVFEGQMAVGCTSFSLGKLIELKALGKRSKAISAISSPSPSVVLVLGCQCRFKRHLVLIVPVPQTGRDGQGGLRW